MADQSVVDRLRELNVKDSNVLMRMAKLRQLLEVKCEMPQCYHPEGRREFEKLTPKRTKWSPSRDHYPILESAGGKLSLDNVRLSHTECNQRDYTRRKQIGELLEAGKSLKYIADTLNRKDYPPGNGRKRWTAAMVRKAYVS
jgi:hypothetical protein